MKIDQLLIDCLAGKVYFEEMIEKSKSQIDSYIFPDIQTMSRYRQSHFYLILEKLIFIGQPVGNAACQVFFEKHAFYRSFVFMKLR